MLGKVIRQTLRLGAGRSVHRNNTDAGRRVATRLLDGAIPSLAQRFFATAGEKKLKENIRSTLKEELEADDEKAELDNLLVQNGWSIEVTPGQTVRLSQTIGADKVSVEILASSQDVCEEEDAQHQHQHQHQHQGEAETQETVEEEAEEEEEGGEAEENPMMGQHDHFLVTVTNKSNLSVRFKCLAQDGILKISKVACLESDVEREMMFDELPEETQASLEEYLVERSLNGDFARIVYLAVNRYDQQYFIDWMHHMNKFLN